MIGRRKLCLNMIVRNESAIIERCLASVADHVACWVIVDTGSTDDTGAIIESFFARRGIPGELHAAPFENFEQARNDALVHARRSNLDYDYMLFLDADMELVVEDAGVLEGLQDESYEARQICGISYWNMRLLRRDVPALYKGVTHEFLDVARRSRLQGAWFVDHATGSNRPEKFERDVRLLKASLDRDPDNARSWFYLAQSYKDAGHWADAMACYARRARMGGWDEEVWYATLQQARCALADGQDATFVHEALRAYDLRPTRAEPLYSLARYYRERQMPQVGLAFCELGRRIPYPGHDLLFVEDSIYAYGLDEEFSVLAFYSPDAAVKERGRSVCSRLAVDAAVPEPVNQLAKANMAWYEDRAPAG